MSYITDDSLRRIISTMLHHTGSNGPPLIMLYNPVTTDYIRSRMILPAEYDPANVGGIHASTQPIPVMYNPTNVSYTNRPISPTFSLIPPNATPEEIEQAPIFPDERIFQELCDEVRLSLPELEEERGITYVNRLKEYVIRKLRTILHCPGVELRIPDRPFAVRENCKDTWYTANEIVMAYPRINRDLLAKVEILYNYDPQFKAEAESELACIRLRAVVATLLEMQTEQ